MGVQIQAIKKCGYLRQIAEGAKSTTITLKAALLGVQKGVYSPTFQKGRIVVSQSGSGQAGSFQISGADNTWTQDNIFGLCEELLMMVEAADPVLYPDDADPTHTDALRAQIAANVMMGNIPETVRSIGSDFTLLNIPVFGTGLQS